MVKIKWIITDAIKGVSLKEFDAEWDGIYGRFELCINEQSVGFCPNRELLPDEWGFEDITDWLYELPNMVVQLNNCQECEWHLLALNLAKIVIKKEDVLVISLIHYWTGETWWSEKVPSQEFITELLCAIDKFIEEIRALNPDLLNSRILKKIIGIRGELSQTSLLDLPDN